MPARGKATSKFNMKMKEYGKGKSPFKGFFGDLAKGKGALGILNPMGAIASKTGLLMTDKQMPEKKDAKQRKPRDPNINPKTGLYYPKPGGAEGNKPRGAKQK